MKKKIYQFIGRMTVKKAKKEVLKKFDEKTKGLSDKLGKSKDPKAK